MKWPVILLVIIGAVCLIGFLVWRNIRDEKDFEKKIKNDYPKPKDDEGDVEVDEVMK